PEIEAVRHRHRGESVAAREAAVRIAAAAGVDEIAGTLTRIGRRGTDAQVIQIALETYCRTVVDQQDALDRAPGGDTAQIDRQEVPLVRIQRAALALRMRRYPDPVLVDGTAGGQMTAIVELQIHRHVVRRIAQVAR